MKSFKSTIIFLSLFLCSVLSAQEAQKSIDLSETSNEDFRKKVSQFAEEFIQPIMRGETYNIKIGDIKLLSTYQKDNLIKCSFNAEETFNRNRCHDRKSYYARFEEDYFDEEPDAIVFKPFNNSAHRFNLNENKSIIIPFSISLKSSFKRALLEFLEAETSGKDVMSYLNLPDNWTAQGRRNEYIRCNHPNIKQCEMSLGRQGGILPYSADSFVINFIDRERKEVTYYNLAGYRQELLRARKHRFLTNICNAVKREWNTAPESHSFTTSYLSQDHVQFSDIAFSFYDKDNEEVHRVIINTQSPTAKLFHSGYPALGTDTFPHTFGLASDKNFFFAYDYGSNAIAGRYYDHLGNINLIGHLITGIGAKSYSRECDLLGVWAEDPAFSFVSNYEYHLIVNLNENLIQQIASVKIKHVPGNTSVVEY